MNSAARKKGVSPLLAAVLVLVISVALTTLVSSFLSTFSAEKSLRIKNITKSQLECQFADIEIKNATYNCANNCAAGITHNLTVTVFNSGRISVGLEKVFVQNETGSVFEFEVSATILEAAITSTLTNTSTATCNGINKTVEKITVSSNTCPDAFDSLPGDDVIFVSC